MALKQVNKNTVFETNTGEIFSSKNTNYLVFEQKTKLRENFMVIFQEALRELAKDKNLTACARRILDFFLSVMDYDNEVYLNQKEIAHELETTQQQISKSIRLLQELGYIKIVKTRGTVYLYKIIPDLALRGGARKREKLTNEWHDL
jgi:biotin operon repressor